MRAKRVFLPDPLHPREKILERTQFFDFLAGHGITRFYLDAQARRLRDGKRGGLLAAKLKTGGVYPRVGADVERGLNDMCARLASLQKRLVDLSVKAAEGRDGKHRLLLADDLDEDACNSITSWWHGAAVILESSPNNFQALLISPHPLDRSERHAAQQFFVARFGSDPAATSGTQPHRYPGSPNFKELAMKTGQPFFCRLARLEGGVQDERGLSLCLESLQEALSQTATQGRPGIVVNRSRPVDGNSERAWREARAMVRDGRQDADVLDMLTQKYLTHHDAQDWPARTLASVKFLDARRRQ